MPIQGGLPPRNPHFVGREGLLAEVRGLLGKGPVALLPAPGHEVGGTGRTQLAVEYVYRYADAYDLVWWIPAEQTAGMRAALVGLAQELKLPEARDLNSTLGAVRDALSRGEPHRNWLIVFANANRPEDIRPYLPSGAGHVLVTSRNPRWTTEVAQAVPVAAFDRTDSVDLLRRRGPDLSADDAERLAERLGDVPMALDQAAAVRKAAGWSAAEYQRRYVERAAELAFPTPIRVAWGLSADALAEASPAAYELLELCAFLASAPVSWELLWAARGRVSAELDGTVRIERRLKAALRLIGRYGLADLDPPGESVLVHPLVRGMVGQQLSSERHAALLRSVRAMLAAADPGDPDNPAHWPRYSAIVAHLVHADVLGSDAEEIRQLVINCIRFLYARGDWDSSRDLAEQAVARWRDDLGEADEQTLLASFHLANALRSVGLTADARDLNARTLRSQREALGADDETTLATANSVGADLRMQGHFSQARQLDADNLVRYRRLFGESFPTALRCANNLAVDLRLLGDFRGARALDEQVLRHRQMIFVEGHPETLSSRAGLAFDLLGLGDNTGATELLSGGHAEALGAGHPMALWVGRFAAIAARRCGLPQARQLAEANVELFRQRFGDANVETLGALVSLANCVRDDGDLDEAHRLLERAVADYRAVLGAEHPFTLAAATDLAGVVRATGRFAQARTMDAEALGGLRRSVGADHPFTLSCANGLAADLIAIGEAQQAREIALDTLSRSRVLRGAEHPDTLACAFNVSLDTGDELSTQLAIEELRKFCGDSHPLLTRALAGVRLETEIEPPPL
ncbi:FxSxx-COOH system tetratricopeptide repeat protein [Actinoplanes sp. NPDC049118]|uniref:FxSxx-COOH system tetratricopeptide repeat protein n=1 Tax=Actinoplanes sp. NPDC049118 TaxID=3155769 RepID=UPI00340C2B93